jgi:Tfp pilus assembly protein PilX
MKKINFIFKNNGLASLPTVLAIAILILAVVVAVTSWTLSESLSTQGQNYSQLALTYAEAGARDALTLIARKYTYNCVATDCYTIDMVANGCTSGDGCAKISVSANSGGSGDEKIITSKGIASTSTRRMQVSVSISTDGQITGTVWTELTN